MHIVSKADIKLVKSLKLKKFRTKHKAFVCEGIKIVQEILNANHQVLLIVALKDWINSNKEFLKSYVDVIRVANEQQLKELSELKTPNQVLAVVAMPPETPPPLPQHKQWHLLLDNIQDPGNMGTIIRTADWFGLRNIYCTGNCVDIYNPKVVQSAMGSMLRVQFSDISYDLVDDFSVPLYAAALDGKNLYNEPAGDEGVLIIGNESSGISKTLLNKAQHKITIPGFGGAESLNAAVAAGICMAFIRQKQEK